MSQSDPLVNTTPSVASAPFPVIDDDCNDDEHTNDMVPLTDTIDETSLEIKSRKRKSKVWLEFDEKKLGDGSIQAICVHCKRAFDSSSSKETTHLMNHTKICMRRSNKDVKQQLLSVTKSSKEPSKLTNWKYDPEKSRMDFAKMIAKHDYSFSMGEHEYFQLFVNGINPMVKFYSRNTRRADLMKVYNEMKIGLQDLLDQLPSRCSFTTNLWTSDHQELNYSCLTCHYIDNDWRLNKKIISFELIQGSHSGEALSGFIKSKVLNWNLDKKIFSITVDNTSNNDVMTRDLKDWLCSKGMLALNGDLFHIRCSAHILNLIVQDGLKEIDGILNKIRESVKFVKSSTSRSQKFASALAHTRLTGKGVSRDVPNRWNSTYLMLDSALAIRSAYERLAELAPDYKCLPSSEEWEVGRVICDCLRVFYDTTLHFSGVKYPTANLYFKGLCGVYDNIIQWLISEHDYVRQMAFKMIEKFDKYWSNNNLLMSIGVILDPCCKMEFIEFVFSKIYGEDADMHINKVKKSINELYSKYVISDDSCTNLASGSIGGGLGIVGDGSSNTRNSRMQEEFKKFIQKRSQNLQQVQKTELDKYLDEGLFPLGEDEKSFDILLWWKSNGPKFPTLARMARDILAVPVSTVVSESAFSSGGRIITESRSSLSPEIMDALVCIKDWLPSLKDAINLVD